VGTSEAETVTTPTMDGAEASGRGRAGRGTPGTTRATALARRTRDEAAARANAEEDAAEGKDGCPPARARRLISDAVSSKPEEGSRRSRIIDRCL